MKYFIYTLNYNNEIFYVGKSKNLKERLRKHLQESKLRRTHKENFINKILCDGGEITINLLDTVDVGTEDIWEIFWISKLKESGAKLLNGTSGGEGGDNWSGRTHTEDTKEKIRQNLIKKYESGFKFKPCKGESNGRSKLTSDQVIEIRRLREKENYSFGKLSIKFGVSDMAISHIIKRKRWKHI